MEASRIYGAMHMQFSCCSLTFARYVRRSPLHLEVYESIIVSLYVKALYNF